MTFLSIDFGTIHIGLAIASSPLAEPYAQLKNDHNLIPNLIRICEQENIDKVIVGVSENQMLEITRQFIEVLRKNLAAQVIEYDETLSSVLASKYLVESGAPKKKRQEQDHQIAAAIILQSYLDDHHSEILE